MDTNFIKFSSKIKGTRIWLIIFSVLVFSTLVYLSTYFQGGAGLAVAAAVAPGSAPASRSAFAAGLKLTADLSQSKVVQGENGIVYLKIGIDTPDLLRAISSNRATDMVIVLDHSPSMAEDNKIKYAKSAILDLLGRLTDNDRVALVVFDSDSQIISDYVSVTKTERSRLSEIVQNMSLGSGTNIGAGLEQARKLVRQNTAGRSRRVLVLSDGEANVGLTDTNALGELAQSLNQDGAIVSTIGMGLSFNERTLSSIADKGAGTYDYLEHLAGLDAIFAKNLSDARQVFAQSSTVRLNPGINVNVTDAGGYPFKRDASGFVEVTTGQLLAKTSRQFFVTLQVPTANLAEYRLSDIGLGFVRDNAREELRVSEPLLVAVLPQTERPAAYASVKSEILRTNWLANNFGQMQIDFRDALARNDKARADQALSGYLAQVGADEKKYNQPILNAEVQNKVSAMRQQLNEAFSGTYQEQQEKQNRLGKQVYSEGLKQKRYSK
jgi:Ca-activated chloride channel family protein